MKRADGLDGLKLTFHTVSRRSQPPLPLRLQSTPRVGGGSAFFVRQHRAFYVWTIQEEAGSQGGREDCKPATRRDFSLAERRGFDCTRRGDVCAPDGYF